MKISKQILAASVAAAFALTAHAGSDQNTNSQASMSQKAAAATAEFKGEAHDAWLDGKLEAIYLVNRGLSAFDIETRVNNGQVLLTGAVKNEAQKQLAEQIALSVKGIKAVDNQLTISADAETRDASDGPTFADRIEDATLAAMLKTRLALNSEVKALKIDVDVENRTATLKGTVSSATEAELAEHIAKNTEGIRDVQNKLEISRQS